MATCIHCQGTGVDIEAISRFHQKKGYGPWRPGQPVSMFIRWEWDIDPDAYSCRHCGGTGEGPALLS